MPFEYLLHGWKLCRIPFGSKGPNDEGWNVAGNEISQDWMLPEFPDGVGLLHVQSGTCALDIDDLTGASMWLAERGVNLQWLLDAPDAVQIVSGRAGRAKLLYRLPFPLPTKKIAIDRQTLLELRCAAANGNTMQDVLPPSIHPDTMGPYQWGGAGDWRNLPLIPQPLLDVWTDLLPAAKPANEDTPPREQSDVTEATIASALQAIDPDTDRKTWVEVGMSIAAVFPNDTGFRLWNEWSSKGEKYKPTEMLGQWRSFKQRDDGIRIGTLIKYAIDNGWRPPPPDLTKMFGAVTPTKHTDTRSMLTPSQKPPTVDPDVWPEQLRNRSLEVATEVGCDPIVPLVAGLAAVSAAVDKRITLRMNGTWNVPPTVWMMTLGDPADKKTPGSKPMFDPLKKFEQEDKPNHAAAMLAWQGKEARHAAQMKAYRDWQASPEAELPNAVPPKMEGLPPEPANLRLIVQDATSQKVVSMAEHRPRGFLLWLDEMNRWLTKLSDPRTTDDRGCWIQGYETGAYTMDRQGAGTIHAENLAMSIYGNCQPQVFRNNCAAASADGILQRFMPISIDPTKNAMWQQSLPDFLSHAGEYETMLRRVYTLPVRDYTLSDEAMGLFRQFSQWSLTLREMERRVRSTEAYRTALGKLEGNCARIMLLFHLVENPYSQTVSYETATRAIHLMKTFFVPSVRHAFLEVGQQRDPLADQVADYVLQCSSVRATVTLGELRTRVKHLIGGRSAKEVEQAIRLTMDELCLLGYTAVHVEHPVYPSWSINPAIAETFKAERQAIIAAKQAIIDHIEQDVGTRGKSFVRPLYAIGNAPGDSG